VSQLQDVQMHGAGNRFLLHFGEGSLATLLQKASDCDGLLLVQNDEHADARMRIFNADGNEAQQCGNGLRCVALHLVRSRCLVGPTVTVQTLSGIHSCVVHEDRNEVEVTLCTPKSGAASCNVDALAISDLPDLQFVNVGNPNAVLWTTEDPIELRKEWGETIVQHGAFLEGMNLHVARRDAAQFATCASWERGVGPTLASGTGGASVFVASNAKEQMYVSSLGGTLAYHFDTHGNIVMSGPAGYV